MSEQTLTARAFASSRIPTPIFPRLLAIVAMAAPVSVLLASVPIASNAIEPAQSSADVSPRMFQLAGQITRVDTAARTFVMHNVKFDYSAATFVNGTASSLADGGVVKVQGPLPSNAVPFRATRITFL